MTSSQPDALLLLSFGGPEQPDDVMPFLRRVTAGRNVPDERLAAVAEHYLHFGGASPINALNREIVVNVERELARRGWDLPVYFGNRNWHPLAEDTAAQMVRDGVRSALVFATSAWGGYSGCRQYREDIARTQAAVAPETLELVKLPQFFDHPLFVAMFADAVKEAQDELDPALAAEARLIFTAHSVPLASGGRELYNRQVHEAAVLVAGAAGVPVFDLVWQSRSGPPAVPWLEPDICDHIEALAQQGVRAVVVCPIGFVSDHMEVIWDLDNEARELAESLGVAFVRTRTPGLDPRFAQMVVELAQNPQNADASEDYCFLGCCDR